MKKKRLANTRLFGYNMDVALTRQYIYADVAQSVEHLIGNEEVGSSNLLISSKRKTLRSECFFFWNRGKIRTAYFTNYQSVMGTEASAACGG